MKNQVHTQRLSSEFLLFLVVVLIAFSFISCDNCFLGIKKNQHEDLGPISAEITKCIPYQDGDTLKFLDDDGNVHQFMVKRDFEDNVEVIGRDCYDEYFSFQSDYIEISSDSYLKKISLHIDNFNGLGLSIGRNYSLKTMGKYFRVPVDDVARGNVTKIDTFKVDGKNYLDVFLINRLNLNPEIYGDSTIYPNNIYYNYKNGILKIRFANGTYFSRKD